MWRILGYLSNHRSMDSPIDSRIKISNGRNLADNRHIVWLLGLNDVSFVTEVFRFERVEKDTERDRVRGTDL